MFIIFFKELPTSAKKPSKPATETPPPIDEFPTFAAATSDSMFGLSSNTNFFNFKELSIQLLSSFSSFPTSTTTTTTATTLTAPGSDEFIDNEIYKFVLHGGSRPSTGTRTTDGDAATAIEMMNPKEAYENEELGKKIATFQIDTDSDEDESDLENDEKPQQTIIDTKTNANVAAAAGHMNEEKSSSSLLSKERAPKSSDKM